MLAWYSRKGRDEEILLAPSNFYLYTYRLDIVYTINPDELSRVDELLRRSFSGRGLENSDWRVEEVDIPDEKLTRFRELCFRGAKEDLIFQSIMSIFGDVVQKLDYVSIDAGKSRLDLPIIEI